MIRRPGLGAGGEPLAVAATAVIILVTASPWIFAFSGSHGAVAEHIAFAMGAGPIALLVSALPVAAVSIALAGGWLVASPWVIGYASVNAGAWSADLVGGLLLLALGAVAWRAAAASLAPDAPATIDGSPS